MREFFYYCIDVLELIGDVTGWGYQKANIYLFVVVHPLLTLGFWMAWKPTSRLGKLIKWGLFSFGVLCLIALFYCFLDDSIWSMNKRYGKILE